MSNEVYVGAYDGVVHDWTIRRVGRRDRWKLEDVLAVRGTTRKPDPGRKGEDVHIRIEGDRAQEGRICPKRGLGVGRKREVAAPRTTVSGAVASKTAVGADSRPNPSFVRPHATSDTRDHP